MKKKKWLKIFAIIMIIILAIVVAASLFLTFWPAFGAKPSEQTRAGYKGRADNFDGSIFRNESPFAVMESIPDGAVEGTLSKKGTMPEGDIPLSTPSISQKPEFDEIAVTWFGHSSLLLQMHGLNILIDPVFSEVSSPVSFAGSRRFSDLPVGVEELPEIDILIISHDHYDHLDYNTILQLDSKVKQYVVPLGVECHLERWDIDAGKITNMAWWEELNVNGLVIGCTPARHYSGRSLTDRYATLWASWVFKDENHLVFESGDTGYGEQYQEIHEKYGDFDFVMIDCAQYNLRWPSVHQTPEEAFQAIELLGAKYAMPIHWAAFRLASHPWDDSAVRLVNAAENSDITIATPRVGETMNLEEISDYQIRWYEDIK